MSPSELAEWEKLMSGDGKHDMRDSNKFMLNRTKGNIIPRDSKEYRPSIKVDHHDVYLHPHTRHLVEQKQMFRDSQKYPSKPLGEHYPEEHDLTVEEGLLGDMSASNDATLRPTVMSSTLEKKKLDYLR